ncbi:NAD(P)/FAD-dependent oxidoreductase [Paenibacillus glufosinatiresistens]|uniref:NAD(P)/FAD-dependent oxidoreductase n=1 Tax=Paenibacillus glufosinatiresistens TaxID=3070657 RepID=UPI00286DD246|nr:NAD(P)/FAD-dependent oxidoreductase [Paenibacillus sp. YX.27]
MSLEALNDRVRTELDYLAFGRADWVKPRTSPEGHVYDAVIVGGGQSGLGAAFGLLRERVSNILVIDENPEGLEGPWETYARMVTLRTPKWLTSIDLGVAALTFRSWWEAQHGPEGWEALDKIPRGEWMSYLRWFRRVLGLPVRNEVRLKLIEKLDDGLYRLHTEGEGSAEPALLARKVVLATGIQGGGEWHVPELVSSRLSGHLYAHTSQPIDFAGLRGRRIGILGGGASAFDNANYALAEGAAEVHVFVRREELPSVNPIRQMEVSGMIERFHTLRDDEKYAAISHFFRFNQPPTNDTFRRAASRPGFRLHLGSPWLDAEDLGRKARISTPKETFEFDYLIISTGLMSDPALRPELRLLEPHLARWSDRYQAPAEAANPLLDAHPYLTGGFAATARTEADAEAVYGLFIFNYSALVSCGLSASAISGTRHAVPKLASAVADQLFLDDKASILNSFFAYSEPEFLGEWPQRA